MVISKPTHPPTHTPIHTHPHTDIHTHTHRHTDVLTHTQMHSHTHTPHTPTHTHTHTHRCTHLSSHLGIISYISSDEGDDAKRELVRITACCGAFTEEGLGQLIEPANELLQNISDLHTKVLAPSAMHLHVHAQDGSLEKKIISMCSAHAHTRVMHTHTCTYTHMLILYMYVDTIHMYTVR